MKQKIILAITLLSILLTGCSSSEESRLVDDGKIALERHDYKEAMNILSSALEEDSTDDNARAMYTQAMRMLNLSSYEEQGNYEKAIKEIEFIEDIKGGSSVIKNEVSSKKKELIKLKEEEEEAEQERKEAAKITASKDKYKLQYQALQSNKKKEEEEKEKEKEKEEEEKEEKEKEKEKKEEENKKEDNKGNKNNTQNSEVIDSDKKTAHASENNKTTQNTNK